MADERPNIVFIMPDQWRHDAFGFAGNPVIETPNVDALAARGAVFRGAHCESPACQPSRASLLTGLYPRDHGLHYNVPKARGAGFPHPEAFRMFPQRLREAGYYTAAVGKLHFGGPHDRASRAKKGGEGKHLRQRRAWIERYGFDHVAEEVDKPPLVRGATSNYTDYLTARGLLEEWRAHHYAAAGSTGMPGLASRCEPLDPEDTLDMFIARQASDFIETHDREQPFFLWVTPVGPHHPLDAPMAYHERYRDVDVPMGSLQEPPIPDNRYGTFVDRTPRPPDKDAAQRHARNYYANCTQVDAGVGRVLSALGANGLGENTWVVFASDHGEMLGDHGLLTKGVFYRGAVQIPCVIAPPAGRGAPSIIDEPTQGFDITATILDIARADGSDQLGRSLLPALDREPVGRDAVFSEYAGFCMVATRRYKLVVDSASATPQQLFDLENDPDERNDLCPEPRARDTVRELMDGYLHPFLAGDFPEPSNSA